MCVLSIKVPIRKKSLETYRMHLVHLAVEKINRVVIRKHTVSGRKTIANEKRTMDGRELWIMEDKEGRGRPKHSQWKEALHVCHV